jgi:hypothetical protein
MGYKATVVSLLVDSDVRLDSWLAPQLGCAQVKYTAENLVDGQWVQTAYGNPMSIMAGEPDARLFDLGEDYEVVSQAVAKKCASSSLGH